MKSPVNIFWFRRDLRLDDNAGLYYALKSSHPVLPVFIFDRNILDLLENKADRRVEFIYNTLEEMQAQLVKMGSSLKVYYGYPEDVFNKLLEEFAIEKVFTNHDYEPYAKERDEKISKLLHAAGVSFHTCKDQVIFERDEVLKDSGEPYTVYTPYSRKWKQALTEFYMRSYPVKKYFRHFYQHAVWPMPALSSMGFKAVNKPFPSKNPERDIIRNYAKQRDYPGIAGTTHIGIHLRFGTVSIRKLVQEAKELNDTYLNELIWREFYQMILWHFPGVGQGKSFKPAYDNIQWRHDEKDFERWCKGITGYPIVDAGMRELNETGYMHNRVRMVTASFLCKHLLIDWRWGEAYFAEKLLDFDLAANNGSWQWTAGSGCDAAPYFRIFNPALQTKKFDPDLTYIRKWVPELDTFDYAAPIVDHEMARERCLKTYAKALKNEG